MKRSLALLFPLAAFAAEPAFIGAEHVRQDFQVRLLTPLASYSRPGTPFTGQVVGPVLRDRAPIVPAGTLVRGSVRSAYSIGLGIRRERASLELAFDSCELPGGAATPCDAALVAIDNAREAVPKENSIRGILAANHPYRWFNGLWFRPATDVLPRSATGMSRFLQTRFAPNPIAAGALMTSRLALFRLPNPEIELPAGTDLIVSVSAPAQPPSPPILAVHLRPDLADWLRTQPAAIVLPDGAPAADIVNVVLFGSRGEIETAFASAGWSEAEPLGPRSFARIYSAYAAMRSYPTAPVSPLLYEGRLPDLVFQRSFNTIAKRHHVRLWEIALPDGPAWLAAATHDTSITLDWNRMSVTHRINPSIDRERSRLVNDLSFAGCLAWVDSVARPELASAAPEGSRQPSSRAITDGALAVASIRECDAPASAAPVLVRQRRSAFALGVRRLILEARYHLTRGNAYYWAYRALRWGNPWKKTEPDPDE